MRSYLPDYVIVTPSSVSAALELLVSGENWRPFSGGTDLMVLLNAGKLAARNFVSLRKLDELRRIEVNDATVKIGAAVTYTQMQGHAVLRSEFPLLCQAAGWTGGVANQNQGTLGGNIANASPAADSAPPLLVYDARIHLRSASGSHCVAYSEFHLGYKRFVMKPDELLDSIELPRRDSAWLDHGRKVGTRRAQAISKVSFAASARIDQRQVSDIRLAFASVAPVPLRCLATEGFLRGKPLTSATIENALRLLKAEISPISDLRSTANYRSQVAQNLLANFLMSAVT